MIFAVPDPNNGGISGLVKGVIEVAGDPFGSMVRSAIDDFVQSIAEGAVKLVQMLATFWMGVPSPQIVEPGTDHPTALIMQITSDLSFYTIVFAMIGVFLAAGKVALSHRGSDLKPVAYMIVALTIVTGAGASVVALLIQAGDQFAPWIIQRATGGTSFSESAHALISVTALTGQGAGMGLLVSLAALCGSLAQFLFMIFRSAMITLLMCVAPSIAATSATEGGSAALRKAGGWLLAFILYKPTAAIVYAVGFMMIKGNQIPGAGGTADQAAMMEMLVGLTVIVLAAFTLPALVKFLVPMASAGVSTMFSGAAVGAAAVAVGAAVVTMGAGAGAGAGGGAASKAAVPPTGPVGASPAASVGSSDGAATNAGTSAGKGSGDNAQGAKPSDGGGHSGGGGAHQWKDAAQTARGAANGLRSASDGVDEGGAGPAGAPVGR